MTIPLQQRLRVHLKQLARPRHTKWDPLGLMSVRVYPHEQLGALGKVEERRFQAGSEAGINLILRLPGQHPSLAPLLVGPITTAP